MKALSDGWSCSSCNQGGRSGDPNLEAINFTSIWPAEWDTKIQTLVSPMETYIYYKNHCAKNITLCTNPFINPFKLQEWPTWIFSIHFQEKMQWALMTWTQKGNALIFNQIFQIILCEKYGDQSEEFVCGYCGLKG